MTERPAEDVPTLRRRTLKMLAEYQAEGGHAMGEADCLVELQLLDEKEKAMRKFETGATRSSEAGKPDLEAFLSPLVLQRYGEYMLKHQTCEDGSRRPGDNWQKGIPLEQYMKSKLRHDFDAWLAHRAWPHKEDIEESLCAVLFNTMGYLHELLKKKLDDGQAIHEWYKKKPAVASAFPAGSIIARKKGPEKLKLIRQLEILGKSERWDIEWIKGRQQGDDYFTFWIMDPSEWRLVNEPQTLRSPKKK